MFVAIDSFMVLLDAMNCAAKFATRDTQKALVYREMDRLRTAVFHDTKGSSSAYASAVNRCLNDLSERVEQLFQLRHIWQAYEISIIRQYILGLRLAAEAIDDDEEIPY